jgi:hypothetical protein
MDSSERHHGSVSGDNEVSDNAVSEPFRWVSPQEIIGDDEGPSGVREPRRPRPPHHPGAAEKATPPGD